MEDTILTNYIDDNVYNIPPDINQSELPSDLNLFTNYEVILIFGVLIFGLLCLIGLSFLLNRKSIQQERFTILTVVILVIVAALFMLIAGFSSEQTTPLIALLGTIVGYVLGNKADKT